MIYIGTDTLKNKILITGASGYVGRNLVDHFYNDEKERLKPTNGFLVVQLYPISKAPVITIPGVLGSRIKYLVLKPEFNRKTDLLGNPINSDEVL